MEIDDIAHVLNRAVAHLQERSGVRETIEGVVRHASDALPQFEHVALSAVTCGVVTTLHASTSLARELDSVQYELGEGPAVDATDGAALVAAASIKHDQRWPSYVPLAVDRGVGAQLAMRLVVDDAGSIGALNLYSTTTDQVSSDTVAVAEIFASHATLALGRAREVSSFREAIESRQTIGMAIGLLMERFGMDEAGAKAFLWRLSSTSNVKVRVVAAELVALANGRAAPDGTGKGM